MRRGGAGISYGTTTSLAIRRSSCQGRHRREQSSPAGDIVLRSPGSRWPELEQTEKRKIIENILQKIVIGHEDVAISLCYLPSSAEIMTERQRNVRVALPFCHSQLRAPKPPSINYPREINTLGDHIRKRRLDLNLLQKQVADQIGVHEQTITGWERNATSPEIHFIPAILNFLGYNPIPQAQTLPDRLVSMRKMLGLSQRKMAEKLGVDPATLMGWEAGRHRPTGKSLDVIGRVLQIR